MINVAKDSNGHVHVYLEHAVSALIVVEITKISDDNPKDGQDEVGEEALNNIANKTRRSAARSENKRMTRSNTDNTTKNPTKNTTKNTIKNTTKKATRSATMVGVSTRSRTAMKKKTPEKKKGEKIQKQQFLKRKKCQNIVKGKGKVKKRL